MVIKQSKKKHFKNANYLVVIPLQGFHLCELVNFSWELFERIVIHSSANWTEDNFWKESKQRVNLAFGVGPGNELTTSCRACGVPVSFDCGRGARRTLGSRDLFGNCIQCLLLCHRDRQCNKKEEYYTQRYQSLSRNWENASVKIEISNLNKKRFKYALLRLGIWIERLTKELGKPLVI